MWKIVITAVTTLGTMLFFGKKAAEENEFMGPVEPWEEMTLVERLSHISRMPYKDLAVLITITYGVVNITRSFVDYKKR